MEIKSIETIIFNVNNIKTLFEMSSELNYNIY